MVLAGWAIPRGWPHGVSRVLNIPPPAALQNAMCGRLTSIRSSFLVAYIHTYEPSTVHFDKSDCAVLALRQQAITGLCDALQVLRTSPLSTTDLARALDRSIYGVTALKSLQSLGTTATETVPCGDFVASNGRRQDVENSLSVCPTTAHKKRRRSRRYFDVNYKRQVVEMIRQQHLTIQQASKDLNLTYSAVRRWMSEFDTEPTNPVTDNTATLNTEHIRALEERLGRLQADNELLKKTAVLFAREIDIVSNKPSAAK